MRGLMPMLGLALTLGLAACGAGDSAHGPTDVAGPVDPATLDALPRPDLGALPAPGREAIAARRAALEAALAEPEPAAAGLAEAFGELGRVYHAHELLTAAEPAYRNAERLDPERFDWPYLLGHLHRMAGRHAEAAAAFERALSIAPEQVAAQVWLAESWLALEDLDSAEAAARAALAIQPDAAPALIALARVTSLRDDPAQTVELLERARRVAPQASEIHYPLGLAYRALGDEEKAAAFLAQQGGVKARLEDPVLDGLDDLVVSAGAALNRGTRAMGQGDLAEAEREFRSAIELEPANIRGYTNLAVALAGKGDGPGAMAALEQALRIEPDNARAQFNLASLLARYGRPDEAARHFEAALAADPGYDEAHFNYANTLVRLERLEEARAHYARVVELDPGNRDAHLMQAMLLVRLERWPEALAAFETAREALPRDATIANGLARLLASAPLTDPDSAARALDLAEALVAEARDLDHGEAQAMALAAAGRFDEALELQRALLDAARRAGQPELVRSLEENLSRYEQGQPAAAPWTADDPNLPGIR